MNHFYEMLASSLEYPNEQWHAGLDRCQQCLTAEAPDVAAGFIEFRHKLLDLPIDRMQEIYTQTFDLNPVCTLDIGYHLFGENYKRGELLAKLRETEEPFELGQANQLPDQLPVLLRLLPKLEDEELRLALISEILIPALIKMTEALSHTDNPYRYLIEMINNSLRREAPRHSAPGQLGNGTEIPELYRISSRASMRNEENLC